MWDDDHLFFADICPPQTIANLRAGSLIEASVVAAIHQPRSSEFAEGIERMRAGSSKLTGRVKAIVRR